LFIIDPDLLLPCTRLNPSGSLSWVKVRHDDPQDCEFPCRNCGS
jgi:hypothetical protein